MNKCQECGIGISDEYSFCTKCNSIKDYRMLGKLNNNLYALRTILEFNLQQEHKAILKWDLQEKKFVIIYMGDK